MGFEFSRESLSLKIFSHACALVSIGDLKILSDPWLFGTCFNSGWSLLSKTEEDCISIEDLNSINYLYISHEHPDHFHMPSLKWLAKNHSNISSVRVLIKDDTRSRKSIAPALSRIGFTDFCFLRHGERFSLPNAISAEIYFHRHIDSALLLFDSSGPFLLNLNDAELGDSECALLFRKYGPIPIILNQFSIAGFDGILSEARLQSSASKVIDRMISQHRCLHASVTVPFASFCWFSASDNNFLNAYHNSLRTVYSRFCQENLPLFCLEPPSESIGYDELIESPRAPQESLRALQPSDVCTDINNSSLEELVDLIRSRCESIFSLSNKFLTYLIDPRIPIYVLDRDILLVLNVRTFDVVVLSGVENYAKYLESGWYLQANFQPLVFAFGNSFGIQTLGVSGRYKIKGISHVPNSWKLIRICSSLDNNKTPLRFSTLFSADFYQFIADRGKNAAHQIRQQFSKFLNF